MQRSQSLGALAVVLTACGGTNEPTPTNPTTNSNNTSNTNNQATGPTYHQDVRPLLADRCGGCHLDGGIAPFSFETYEGTGPLAAVIAASVRARRMPPWGAHDTDECQVQRGFKHDLRLTEDEIALIEAWSSSGAAEGEPVADPAPFGGELSTLPRVDAELVPDQGFATSGSSDQFRCFVLDPGFRQQAYLQGLAFVPGNEKVVHHAIVYADPSGEGSAALANAEGQYDCFGGPGFDDSFLVSAWAPGGVPLVFPDKAAMPLSAGSKLILQIHYHPLGDTPEQDLTKVQIMYTDEAPEYLAGASFIGNFGGSLGDGQGLLPGPGDDGAPPRFAIPAGASEHTEQMALTVPYRVDTGRFPGAYIHSVASHMHYVGTDMIIELERGVGSPPCSAAQADPLSQCIAAACPNATGFALATCAENSCGDELGALSAFCGACLQEEVIAGSQDAVAACSAPMSLPTDLYPDLADQPAQECLLQTPGWNFEWQRFYEYDARIEDLPFVMSGDTFKLTCKYDNSMANPFVREALAEQGLDAPREVVLGDETLDEMCLLAVTFFYKAP